MEVSEIRNTLRDVIRSVTFRAPSPCKVWPLNDRTLSQNEVEWRRIVGRGQEDQDKKQDD